MKQGIKAIFLDLGGTFRVVDEDNRPFIAEARERIKELLCAVGFLPGNAEIFPPHVAVSGKRTVNRLFQIKVTDDGRGTEIKDLFNSLLESIVTDSACAAGIYQD